MALPPLPLTQIEILDDLSPADQTGFLRLRRHRLRLRYADGATSEAFVYDSIGRKALDAVVIAAHYQNERNQRCVYLRSAVRPPARLRPEQSRPLPEKDTLGVLWEMPAGLVEADECHPAGLRACAARELMEELGFSVAAADLLPLGLASFPTPGVIGERHHFFHVVVKPESRSTPPEDGSVLERRAAIAAIAVDEALDFVDSGDIEDAKTELALRRLAALDR